MFLIVLFYWRYVHSRISVNDHRNDDMDDSLEMNDVENERGNIVTNQNQNNEPSRQMNNSNEFLRKLEKQFIYFVYE